MHLDIAVYDGCDELDALGPLEVLRGACHRGAPLDAHLVALEGPRTITGAHGVVVRADGPPRDQAQVVVMTGGGWVARAKRGARHQAQQGRWVPVLTRAQARGATLAAVCTGTMILAAAGVIGARRATTHHLAMDELAAAGATVVPERVVDDGSLITAGGVTAGIDLGLWLVERWCGQELADQVAEGLEYQRFRPGGH